MVVSKGSVCTFARASSLTQGWEGERVGGREMGGWDSGNKALQIKRECKKLYAMLRQNIGHTFLESVRTVIAHPVSNNEFLRSIVYNFVPGTTGPKLQGKSGG